MNLTVIKIIASIIITLSIIFAIGLLHEFSSSAVESGAYLLTPSPDLTQLKGTKSELKYQELSYKPSLNPTIQDEISSEYANSNSFKLAADQKMLFSPINDSEDIKGINRGAATSGGGAMGSLMLTMMGGKSGGGIIGTGGSSGMKSLQGSSPKLLASNSTPFSVDPTGSEEDLTPIGAPVGNGAHILFVMGCIYSILFKLRRSSSYKKQ